MIEINGIGWEPVAGAPYKFRYADIVRDISEGNVDQRAAYRDLILNDLWFITYFVMRIPVANHPFWVQACREVEDGPEDFTLDVWAREHGKSSIITIAETLQYALKNPDCCTGIFSYVRPVAKKFLGALKGILQNERILYACFPDVVWENCEKQAPLWSYDEGLILRRTSNRPESTIAAWGLVEGMPTGHHYERRVYDDVVTEDISESVEMMEKVKTKFDSSQNIGKEGGHHRVIGTFYHHMDPLTYIRDKKTVTGKPLYHFRLKPATEDGTSMGVPVFLSEKRLSDLRSTRTFNCQQLLDPSPVSDRSLNPAHLIKIDRGQIPKELYRFMLVDQAGDSATNIHSKKEDSWAVGVVGVEPFTDEIGQSRVFIEDLWITPSPETEAIEQIVRMYLRSRMIFQVCVEKSGLSTTHVHVEKALKAHGRHISFEDGGNGVLLRPAGRNKRKFIEASLSWPLANGKIHYSSSIPVHFIERLKMEMNFFPFWHEDGLNMLAYLYDVLKETHFPAFEELEEQKKKRRYEQKPPERSWMSV